MEPYEEKLHFAIIELPYFPHIKKHLKLTNSPNQIYFFVQDFMNSQFFKLEKEILDT